MKVDRFEKRLDLLQINNYKILNLDEALELLYKNNLPPGATVITIDDGMYTIKKYAHPLLAKKHFPYTIYFTSYYSMKEEPIFNLIIDYLFWKTKKVMIDLERIGLPIKNKFRLDNDSDKSKAALTVIQYGQANLNGIERNNLIKKLGEILNVNYQSIIHNKVFNLLSVSDIQELVSEGVDFQLHSHRHCWPLDEENAIKEIDENRSFLEPYTKNRLSHFCYPSGLWRQEQIKFLPLADIKSATTTVRGFCYPYSPVYTLKRILDSETVHQIEFEAEMSGYLEIIRTSFHKMKNTIRRKII